MTERLDRLFEVIQDTMEFNDKARLARIVADEFNLTKDRSVYYGPDFAVRFSSAAGRNFGNTVLSVFYLHKYDDRPFIVLSL